MLMAAPKNEEWRKSVAGIVGMGELLAEKAKELTHQEFIDFARLRSGLDNSAAKKLINVATNKIISDPKYANGLPPSWAFLYELSFLPDDQLTAIIEDGSAMTMTKYDVWKKRGRMGRGQAGNNQVRATVKVPEGQQLEAMVREGIRMEREDGVTAEVAAKAIGIGAQTFRMVKMAVVLSETEHLGEKDIAVAKEALANMNRTKNVRRYYGPIEPLVTKVFGKGTSVAYDDERVQRRIEKFRGAMVIIQDTCLGGVDLDVPPLPPEVRAEIIERLTKSREAIGQLKGKVLRSHD